MSEQDKTSRDSYREAATSGLVRQRKLQVLEFIGQHEGAGGVSQGDAARHFDDASSSFQPRFRELEDAGMIAVVGTKRDPVTGRMVKAYRTTGSTEPIQHKRRKIRATLQPVENDLFRVTFEPAVSIAGPTTIEFSLAL